MNVTAMLPGMGWSVAVQREVDRVAAIWSDLRARHGDKGLFLFGTFTVADAFFAPVVSRFATYGIHLPEDAKAYADFMLKWGIVKEKADAKDLVTNDLIDDINKFDASAITSEAKAWKK